MNRAHLLAALALGAALTSPAACSDDDGHGDVDAFCDAGDDIKEATSQIDSPESAVEAFASVEGAIDELVDTAPDAVGADAAEFARHVNSAIDDGDFAAFEDGSVDEITARMDAFCERG